jgi:hypothetical protein
MRSRLERDARNHLRMPSHPWLRRLPARRVYRHNRACLFRGAAHVLVWQSMELSGRWSLESLRQGASGALPTSHARPADSTHLRADSRASRCWAFWWQTGRSALNMTASTSCTIFSATAFMSGARTAVLTVQAWVGFRLDSVRGRIAVPESGCAQAASWLDKRSR